jgi:threonine dehydrogenase-like Zn-dependent dehydrogenase
MKALVYTAPHRIELRELATPVPAAGEVLLKVEAVGICGSDMHAYHGHDERRPAPLILGHEAAGVIAAGLRTGEAVVINPLVSCGLCQACRSGRQHLCADRQIISMPPRPGAFAEFVTIPERNVIALPAGADFAKAALAEPVAVAWHAVRIAAAHLYEPLATASALVLGAGAIGLASALVLHAFGARDIWIAEPNQLRRDTARRSGPFQVYDPSGEPGPGASSVALVIDAVGAAETRAAASRLVAPGGVIVHVGLLPGAAGFDIRRITLQEITVIGSYCYTPRDFEDVVGALMADRFGDLSWIELRSLADGPAAFRAIDQGETAAAKIVLRP